jgi:hypothetical protein
MGVQIASPKAARGSKRKRAGHGGKGPFQAENPQNYLGGTLPLRGRMNKSSLASVK